MAAALLFDLDGTLVETDHVHFSAFRRVFAPHGVTLDWLRYQSDILGGVNEAIGERFLPHLSAAERRRTLEHKEAVYREEIGAVAPVAGARELIDFCAARGLKCALVTNAPRANVDQLIAALGLENRFDALVLGDELPRGKPDPLPYTTALQRLGARAEASVAFEDSLTGLQAAVGAGLAVVGMMSGLDEQRLIAGGARFAVADFLDPRIYELIEQRLKRLTDP